MRYRKKSDWLDQYIKGKKILYLGCVDEDPENIRKSIAFHKIFQSRARSILGVYYSKDVVAELNASGYDSVCTYVETMALDEKFEIVVSVDVIEHVSNCGLVIKKVYEHLLPEGAFLVSTPNPLSLVRILEMLVYGKTKTNLEHTCWFTRQVLDQLGHRYGFMVTDDVFIDEMYMYHSPKEQYLKKGVAKGIMTWCLVSVNFITCLLFPQFSETIGFVLKKMGP